MSEPDWPRLTSTADLKWHLGMYQETISALKRRMRDGDMDSTTRNLYGEELRSHRTVVVHLVAELRRRGEWVDWEE